MSKRLSYEEKKAGLEQGKPFVVHPREVLKIFPPECGTSPAIILCCILVSGTPDTALVLKAQVCLLNGIPMTSEQEAAWKAFMRVWASPTQDEREEVIVAATKIVFQCRLEGKSFEWNPPPPRFKLVLHDKT